MSTLGVAGISFIIFVACAILWFVLDSFCYSDFADFYIDVIGPVFMVISGIVCCIMLVIGLVEAIEESENPKNKVESYLEKRDEIVESLSVNPFDSQNINNAIDWNSEVEKLKTGENGSDYSGLNNIDYYNYQRKYAKEKLNMIPADGTEIFDETIIEIKEEDWNKIKDYITQLETELDKKDSVNYRNEVENILSQYIN